MKLININIVPCTRITALVLHRIERKRRGAIINVSSLSATFPTPLLTLYSATKTYVDYMSRGLQQEFNRKGIVIQSLLPFYVSTNMNYNMKPRFYAPLPETYVSHAIKTVGRVDRTSGYYGHELYDHFFYFLGLISKIIGIDFNRRFFHKNLQVIRNRIKARKNSNFFIEWLFEKNYI